MPLHHADAGASSSCCGYLEMWLTGRCRCIMQVPLHHGMHHTCNATVEGLCNAGAPHRCSPLQASPSPDPLGPPPCGDSTKPRLAAAALRPLLPLPHNCREGLPHIAPPTPPSLHSYGASTVETAS